MFNFNSPTGLIFGNQTSKNSTDQIINLLGKKIFVISDKGLVYWNQQLKNLKLIPI